jgi:hypothetical protein
MQQNVITWGHLVSAYNCRHALNLFLGAAACFPIRKIQNLSSSLNIMLQQAGNRYDVGIPGPMCVMAVAVKASTVYQCGRLPIIPVRHTHYRWIGMVAWPKLKQAKSQQRKEHKPT